MWAPLAEQQVVDAFAYIASERPAAAIKWFDRLVNKTESLSALPDQGRMVPEAQRQSLREVLVEPYRVVYHRDQDALVILSVQHERRDLDIESIES
ncbi:MAG: type II toxin-antitoxin system RelE/ParE family toxin [Coriobacteriia bacterium]|nr:type II toxin-antitoxin system RelE/ParE family toxin [Coriobacteriia bacterium]